MTLLASAELYDPATGNFTATGSMTSARAAHTATLLRNGMVLITGGAPGGFSVSGGNVNINIGSPPNPLNTAELYDPVTGTFTPTGSMSNGIYLHTATLLNNGMVLIAGGTTSELYNPATGSFTSTGSMNTPRISHTATLLNNGQVLIAGGVSTSAGSILNSAELYNSFTGVFTNTGSLITARFSFTATLLINGQVLIAGGEASNGTAITTGAGEIHDPTSQTFAATFNTMIDPGYWQAATIPEKF